MLRIVHSLAIVLLILSFSFAGPLSEGRKQVGGSIMFQSMSGDLYENSDGDAMTVFQLSPSATMFIGFPGLAVGGTLNFANGSQGDFSSNTWGIGPIVQYYFGADQDKEFYPFVSGAFIYTSMTTDDGTNEVEATQTRIRLSGGGLYLLNNNVGLNAQLTFDMDSMTPDGGDAIDGNVFGVEVGFSIFID
jgi:hypothetical protein